MHGIWSILMASRTRFNLPLALELKRPAHSTLLLAFPQFRDTEMGESRKIHALFKHFIRDVTNRGSKQKGVLGTEKHDITVTRNENREFYHCRPALSCGTYYPTARSACINR